MPLHRIIELSQAGENALPVQLHRASLTSMNWNENSKGVAVVRIVCGVVIILGGRVADLHRTMIKRIMNHSKNEPNAEPLPRLWQGCFQRLVRENPAMSLEVLVHAMKAKRIPRHQSEIADPLRPHTTGILPDADQRLPELLHEWRPECDPLPPHFAEHVWQQIRRSEEPAAQTPALPDGARHDRSPPK